jgi:hypothetical protein
MKLSKKLMKDEFDQFVKHLSKEYLIYGPVARRSDFSFQEIDSAKDLRLDYTTTTIPPKKYFHHRQTLLKYSGECFSEQESTLEKRFLLLGVHSCDLNAILRHDGLFTRQFKDPYYLKLRRNSAIVALTCNKISENCFCASLGSGPTI